MKYLISKSIIILTATLLTACNKLPFNKQKVNLRDCMQCEENGTCKNIDVLRSFNIQKDSVVFTYNINGNFQLATLPDSKSKCSISYDEAKFQCESDHSIFNLVLQQTSIFNYSYDGNGNFTQTYFSGSLGSVKTTTTSCKTKLW